VIHAVRKLARSIRGRPVWQVVAVYVPASWLSWIAVGWLARVSGLPIWTPTMALVLLAIMAPVVLATAVAQRGLPGLRIEDEIDPNELIGLTPEQVHVIPEAHPLHGSPLFTWQNAILGAVSCVVLLVTSVIAYMTMWAFGIGPVGSLVAQGVIREHDPVALISFENHTDDPSLGAFVTDAFELELSRSEVVTLSDSRREGARLVLSGDVVRKGAGYTLGAMISRPTGALVAHFQVFAEGDDDLLRGIESLSERVRERLGESLRVIREGERLAPIASESDEALQLFRRAGRASVQGEVGAAITLLEEAVIADPRFAMAWRRLGVLGEQAGDPARARHAYQRVIDLWASAGVADRTVERVRERLAALD
jgi:hypothetical protein